MIVFSVSENFVRFGIPYRGTGEAEELLKSFELDLISVATIDIH